MLLKTQKNYNQIKEKTDIPAVKKTHKKQVKNAHTKKEKI